LHIANLFHSLLHSHNLQSYNYCHRQYHNYFYCSHGHALDTAQLAAAGLHWTRRLLDWNSLRRMQHSNCLTATHTLSYKPLAGQWTTCLISLLRCHLVDRCCRATLPGLAYCWVITIALSLVMSPRGRESLPSVVYWWKEWGYVTSPRESTEFPRPPTSCCAIHVTIYVCACVCVCVCARARVWVCSTIRELNGKSQFFISFLNICLLCFLPYSDQVLHVIE
jgi:hypothetical protein